MNTNKVLINNNQNISKYQKILFAISSLAILTGFFLSFISWMQFCTQECGAMHSYRLFGIKFEYIGLIYFPLLIIFHFGGLVSRYFSFIAALLLASAVGAEMIFIYTQKVSIGHWCPVCLSIAASIGVASLAYFLSYANNLKSFVNESRRSETMLNLQKGLSTAIAVILGFSFAFFGLGKMDELKAAENSIKDSVAFGNTNSHIDVYFFSDWQCPACRQVEPKLNELTDLIMQKARLTYVDFTIHPSSLNFTPYNLSFMIHNKEIYLRLRDALTELSTETEAPTEEQIEKIAARLRTRYTQLNFSDVTLGLKYFKTLGKEFEIDSTPTLVLVNEKTRKGKKLFGVAEITEKNITEAINKLNEE